MIVRGYMKDNKPHCSRCDSSRLVNTDRLLLLAPPIEVWLCLDCSAEVRFPRMGPSWKQHHSSIIGGDYMEKFPPTQKYDVEYKK